MTESATAREHNQKTLLAKGWVARPRSARAVLRRTDSIWPDLRRQHCLLRLGFGSRVPHAIKSLPLPSLRVYLFKINLRMLLLFSGRATEGNSPSWFVVYPARISWACDAGVSKILRSYARSFPWAGVRAVASEHFLPGLSRPLPRARPSERGHDRAFLVVARNPRARSCLGTALSRLRKGLCIEGHDWLEVSARSEARISLSEPRDQQRHAGVVGEIRALHTQYLGLVEYRYPAIDVGSKTTPVVRREGGAHA